MDKRELKSIERISHLCYLGGIDFAKLLEEIKTELKNRMKALFTPNKMWFCEGKSFERYWKFLEQITKHEWKYEDVDYWYKFVRDPSETREEIPPSLRYLVLKRNKFTCQKCGRKAPNVQLQVDHILPWDYGGPTVSDNLQTLCQECNIGKLNKYFEGSD